MSLPVIYFENKGEDDMSTKFNMPNEDINFIKFPDLIKDELGNYYQIGRTRRNGEKLVEIELINYFQAKSFDWLVPLGIAAEGFPKEYEHKHIGHFLVDLLNNHIKRCEKNNRKIFTVKELVQNDIQVFVADQTSYR